MKVIGALPQTPLGASPQTPYQGLRPWTPLGASPPDPHLRNCFWAGPNCLRQALPKNSGGRIGFGGPQPLGLRRSRRLLRSLF